MKKIYRLSRADFSSLKPFAREHGRLFTLAVAKNLDNKPRFACVVSKKIAKKASERNLIKRRCRAAVREIAPTAPFSFVFTAKSAALGSEYGDMLSEVDSLIVKTTSSLNGVSELQ